jgi:acetyl-CoA synthetase
MDDHDIGAFEELMQRSTTDVAWFTEALLSYLDIRFHKPYTQVVDLSEGIQYPKWCVGGKLNIVYSCIDKWAADPKKQNGPAIIWEGEEGDIRRLSYSELLVEISKCANCLRSFGIGKGDVVGLYMPMTIEIIVALFAIARIGGIILPLFSGYGDRAIAARLIDADAKALFTSDGLYRRGSAVSIKKTADRALREACDVKHVIVAQRTGEDVPMQPNRDVWWHDVVAHQSNSSEIEDTSAEDVLMLIYTSGTSGRPKGTVHTHCGFPIKAAQDMAFGTDVHSGDVIYWPTDMGWMMGPWLVFGATLLGATALISDGAPDFPGPDRMWAMVARHRINALGVSPTLIRALAVHGAEPVENHDLSSIRCFVSTGEPWNPDPWLWLFNVVGKGMRPIINYSGGTEISGGILMGNPLLPLKPTAFSGPCPGIAADVVDDRGNSVRNTVGELVIRAPWIGMTRGFWRDKQRYLDAYWSRWDGIWNHGDWAAVDDDGQWYIFGRSDDTIKVAGKRVGPAEIESILVSHRAISEAAAIGVPHQTKGNAIVCFCVLSPGERHSDDLHAELLDKVTAEMGKPLRPQEIRFISDLPKTRNGKVMRRVIRNAFLGEDYGDVSGLANPEAIAEISPV